MRAWTWLALQALVLRSSASATSLARRGHARAGLSSLRELSEEEEEDEGIGDDGETLQAAAEMSRLYGARVQELDSAAAVALQRGLVDDSRPQPWCSRSDSIVPSPEDLVMQRHNCSDSHVLRKAEFLGHECKNPYGTYLVNYQTHRMFFYLDIPKTGSSNLKASVFPYKARLYPQNIPFTTAEARATNVSAFAFVRHPVLRFISGYGTLIHRLSGKTRCNTKEVEFLHKLKDPERFNKLVDVLVKDALKLAEWYPCHCDIEHIFSQTWFLNFWPDKVKLFHIENMERDLKALGELTGLDITLPTNIKFANKHEGNLSNEVLFQQRPAIQKLHGYFEQEMRRLGYTPLEGYGWH